MSNNKIKIKLELTEKQLDYLSSVFFEYGEVQMSLKKERMYKILDQKLIDAHDRVEKEKQFFLTKAEQKSHIKYLNALKRKEQK